MVILEIFRVLLDYLKSVPRSSQRRVQAAKQVYGGDMEQHERAQRWNVSSPFTTDPEARPMSLLVNRLGDP